MNKNRLKWYTKTARKCSTFEFKRHIDTYRIVERIKNDERMTLTTLWNRAERKIFYV